MECWTIPTSKEPLTIKAGVYSHAPVDLILKGYDPDNANSVYFQREIEFFHGAEEFDIPMRISPERLKVCAYNGKTLLADGVDLRYVKAGPLKTQSYSYNSTQDENFYRFAEWFCKNAGVLKTKEYTMPDGKLQIWLEDNIIGDDGKVSSTPARTFYPDASNNYTQIIEISRAKFDKMTVYMRLFILLHEYFHYRANAIDNEELADKYAAETFVGRGYPKTEALYSFIKIFKPINEKHEQALIQRTDKLNWFLKNS